MEYASEALAILGIAGFVWHAISRYNSLEAKVDAAAAEARAQHNAQAQQLASIQHELTEAKEESRRNTAKVFERLEDQGQRIARLEGRS